MTYRYTNCEQCGAGFKDDCGDSFCSGHCESEYENDHACCAYCGCEVGQDALNFDDKCEDCEEEE
jgi:hypothetical protein